VNLLQHAREGRRIFRITFPDGERIPFRLLTWEEFNIYWKLYTKGTIVSDVLEDELFRECVVDPDCIDRMPDMPAGVVPTVVSVIMQLSGPAEADNFNNSLDLQRQLVDTINSQVIMSICQAFPAYKPEDIEKMPWHTVLERLAQAERILMSMGFLKEPLKLLTPEEAEKAQGKAKGRVRAEDLVKDGRQLASSELGGDPINPRTGETLTPRQMQQLDMVKNMRKRRGY